MKLFYKEDDALVYTVTIKDIMRFDLAIDYVGISLSFRQKAEAIQKAKDRTKTTKLVSLNDCIIGDSRGHRQWHLGQAGLHILSLPTCVEQPDHRHERYVPKENESLGAPGPFAKLLQVVSPLAPGAHQGQAARPDAIGPVVDHHVRNGVGNRRDQHHVGLVAGQVVVDRPVGNSRAELARHDHYHV
ncbi:unnamed protein product [Sphagnum balticum]